MAQENGNDGEEGYQNTVFIDTSLETHLATIVSDSDTVSDLKRKTVLEHRQCFPEIGDIKIHCLKVKRRGNYYHLSDSMLVRSAFRASKKNWFLSVDASQLEQFDGIKHNPGDQLALPWVKDNRSIESHDSQADRPSKLSLIYGSPSKHPTIVPFANQKVSSVDQFTSDGSCKKVSKNIEDRSSNDDHCRNHVPDLEHRLDSNVSKEIKSKKRTHDVQNEDASVKKRRKTQRTEGNVKALEEDRVLTYDADKVKDIGTSIYDENSIEYKSKSNEAALDGVVTKAMNDEDTRTILVRQKKPKRTRKGKTSAHEQVATVVRLGVEDVGEEIRSQKNTEASEVTPDVAVVVEKNIQEEMPFHLSQKEKCNELDQEANIGNEIPSSPMKGVTAEDELVVKHADDLVVDISSSVPTPVFDENIIDEEKKDKANMIIDEEKKIIDEEKKDNANMFSDEKNEDSEKTLVDDSPVYQNKKGDDLIVNEVKIAEPTESHRTRVHRGKSRKEIKETAGSRTKRKVDGKSSKKDEIMKQSNNDAATGTNEDNLLPPDDMKESLEITSIDALHVDHGRNDDIMIDNDAHISRTEKKTSELNAKCININTEKQNEKMDDIKKSKKKKKTKKSAARNEGDNGDLQEKIADVSQVDVGTDGDKLKSKDAQIHDDGLVRKSKRNRKSSTRAHSDMPSKVEPEPEKSKIPEEPSKNMAESQVSNGDNVNNEGNNGDLQEQIADVSRVDADTDGDKLKSKDAQIPEEGLVKKSKRNRKYSTRAHSDMPSKVESEPEKSKIPEEPSKNMAESRVFNGDNVNSEGNNGDLQEKIADVSRVDVGTDGDKLLSKDAQISDEGFVKKSKKNRKSSTRAISDIPSKLESEPEKSKIPEEPSKNMAESEVSNGNNVNNEGNNGDLQEKIADVSRVDADTDGDELKSKDAQIPDEGLVKKSKKNRKSSSRAHSDIPSKLESEPEKSKIPEEPSKNMAESQVSKGDNVNHEVDIPKEGSHEIDFMEYFSPSQQQNKIAVLDKVKKKSKEQDSKNDDAIQSHSNNENMKELLSSKKIPEVSADEVVVKDQNAPNKVKNQKTTAKIDAQKTRKLAHANKLQPPSESGSFSETFGGSLSYQKNRKQQPALLQNHVKNLKKSAPAVKSLLNTPGSIFGDNSDDSSADDNATINSDSSTRTPSGKSSSGESDYSIDSRRYGSQAVKRKQGDGKNNMNSQSRLKNISMADLLRSSSRFKKARVTASQLIDTESEPVDFVPESQPVS